MSFVLAVNGRDLMPAVGELTLEKSRAQAAHTLTASVYLATADNYFPQFALSVGDGAQLRDGEGNVLFSGAVRTLERTQRQVAFTACDQGIFLTGNELYGFFCGTGADIARQVAAKLGISLGTVEARSGYQTIVTTSGDTAFSILRQAAGEGRDIAVKDGALSILRRRGAVVSLGGERFLSVDSRCSLAGLADRAVVLRRGGGVLAQAENAADLAAYGQFQRVETLSGDDAKAQASDMLRGKGFTAEVTVLGDAALQCGGAVAIRQPRWGLEGEFAIDGALHRWRAGLYTTELTLAEG